MRTRAPVLVASGVAVAMVVAGVVALVASLVVDDQSGTSPQAIEAFERAVTPTAEQAGKTVVLGLKVAIGDLGAEHRTAPAVIVEQTGAWRKDLVAARAAFAAADAPDSLQDARGDFVAALDRYLVALDRIRDAALASDPAQRDRLLDAAIEEGRAGDDLYDRAAAVLQRARRDAGLAPNPAFPDPASRQP